MHDWNIIVRLTKTRDSERKVLVFAGNPCMERGGL